MTKPQHRAWWANRAWHTNALLLILGFGLMLLTRQLVSEFDHFTIGFSGVGGWSVIVYLVAAAVILTRPVNRATFAIILTVGIVCRMMLLVPAPEMSSDIYRYAWDGVVQHAHISPYRYVPGDATLEFLREPNQEVFDHINRRDYAHTIYPPAAQMLFYLITFVSPSVNGMKLGMVLLEGLTLWSLVLLLHDLGIRREQALLYAWCPLLIWEIGSSGHIDSAMIAFLVPALLFRLRRKPTLTGLFLGIAVLVKFFPLVLFPALFRRRDWKMPAALIAFVVFAYGCYLSVGLRVFGFIGGYAEEEGVNSGSRFFLLDLARHIPGLSHLPTAAFLIVAVAVMGASVLWCWKQSSPTREVSNATLAPRLTGDALFLQRAMMLAFTTMLLFSPHYPWYVVWLVPFLTLMPNLPVLAYVCGLFYLCMTPLGAGTVAAQYSMNQILYAVVLGAFVLSIVLQRWPLHRAFSPTEVESGTTA